VPHAIGATAYAGVPITYPGSGDTVTFVRGHEDEGREKAKIDWTALASSTARSCRMRDRSSCRRCSTR
jgi:siroheme synthase